MLKNADNVDNADTGPYTAGGGDQKGVAADADKR